MRLGRHASVLCTLICLASPVVKAQGADDLKSATANWNTLLSKHVRSNGGIDYQALKKDEAQLQGFIKAYEHLDLSTASDEAKKAAYINLYNATMMANLLRFAEDQKIDVSSKEFTGLEINGIKVPGGNIWNGDYKVTVAGQKLTLDDIEHGLIRGRGGSELDKLKVKKLDPRIHAAVNCAALSCPRVREVAYTPETVEAMLEQNIREFLSSPVQFRKLSDDKLQANSIVYWYYEDFDEFGKKQSLGGAGDYLATFVSGESADQAWKKKHLKANFNDRGKLSLKLSSAFDFTYDWHVNDVRNKK